MPEAYSDLIDALVARKGELGLSNAFIENALHMGENNLDKLLGPNRVKNLTVIVAHDLAELMGCRLTLTVDPEFEAKMKARWERRDSRKVHPNRRVSKAAMEMARPLIYREWFRNSQTRPGQRSFPGSTAAKSHAQRRFPDGDCIGLRSRPPPPRGRRHDHFVSDRRSV